MDKFIDRSDAGIALSKHLKDYAHKPNTLILALPRGGVPVAFEVAKALAIPLDVFVVRKLGVPNQEELALGAIASGDTVLFNDEIIDSFVLSDTVIQTIIQAEQKELKRRELLYRKNLPPLVLKDKTVILIDDGIATGATMLAALKNIRKQSPSHINISVPVAAYSTCQELSKQVNRFVALLKPVNFCSVGLWYDNFSQTTDDEVLELLLRAHQ